MALVNYLKDIPDENIGFLVSNSNLRDYFVNVVPILTGKNTIEYTENIGFLSTINLLVTNTTNSVMLDRLRKNYSLLLIGVKVKDARVISENLSILDKGESEGVSVRVESESEDELLDLFEGEKLYNRLFTSGFSVINKPVIEKNKKENSIIKLSDEVQFTFFPNTGKDYLFTNVSLFSSADITHSKATAELLLNYYTASELKSKVLTDASSCIGGNTWSFAKMVKEVNAVELNDINMTALKHNMNVVGADNIKFYNDNYMNLKDTLKSNIIFYDPPWGGLDYKKNVQVGYTYEGKFYGLEELSKKKEEVEMLIFRIPMKSNVEKGNWNYRYRVVFSDKNGFPIYHVIILSDKKPITKPLDKTVNRIDYKNITYSEIKDEKEIVEEEKSSEALAKSEDFDTLYGVPDRPSSFNPDKGEETVINELLGWRPFAPVLNVDYFKNFKSGHWGQRKLLLTEILFFTLHGKPNTKVIYAGSAPSDHMLFLSKMFPTYHFDLIDPERWNKDFQKIHPALKGQNFSEDVKKYKINDKIDVYQGFMTDELSRELGEKYKNDNVLFVSDIRPTNIEAVSSTIEQRENIVKENMEMQKRWYLIISEINKKEIWGMFKFKPVFGVNTTEYLDGTLYYQPWAPLLSPELRLITNKTTMKTYDNSWLEQHLSWFNNVRRNLEKHPRDTRIRGIFDVQYEYDIFKMYVDKFAKGTDPYNWMIQTSKELYNKDVVKGKYLFEKGYQTEPSRLNYWATKIVEKMVKYSGGGDMGDE